MRRTAVTRRQLLIASAGAVVGAALPFGPVATAKAAEARTLTPMQHYVLRCGGTEPPGSHPLNAERRRGDYACAGCGAVLFASAARLPGGGWPGFAAPISAAVQVESDDSDGLARDVAMCRCCNGHLGHVASDTASPSGRRWHINGAALHFLPL